MIKSNKKAAIMLILIAIMAIMNGKVFAANFQISSGNTNLNPGNTTTVNINSGKLTGRYDISSSNNSVVSVSSASEWIENTSKSITLTAKAVGEAIITITPTNVSDSEGNVVNASESKNIKITVTNPVVEPTPEPIPPTKPKQSSNANLSKLIVSGLTPSFSPNNTNYTVKVGSDVSKLSISLSTAEDAGTFYIKGNGGFTEGNNVVEVISIAPDGTQKEYKITVVKEVKVEEEEKKGNVEDPNAKDEEKKLEEDKKDLDLTLKSLVISELEINPNFDANVFKYTSTYEGDSDMLEVIATANNKDAKIVVSGNENIAMGENKIVITVGSKDGEESKVYTIVVTKQEKIEKDKKTQEIVEEVANTDVVKSNNTQMYIIGGISITIILILIVLIIITIRKKEPDYGDEDEFELKTEEKEKLKEIVKKPDSKGKRFK